MKIAPSILSANFSIMKEEIARIEKSGAELVHVDVMDGQFVPNLTFGPKMVEDIRPHTRLPLDVHLMTLTPERLVPDFIKAGADWVTFHQEACIHANRTVQLIKQGGIKAGISIVPSTPVEILEPMLEFVDMVLIMTVNPGFGGQAMIPSMLNKVTWLRDLRDRRQLSFVISVDGGVNRTTCDSVRDAGVDIAVAGSAFFGAKDPAYEVQYLKGNKMV